jgi:hypothetical protein
MKGEVKVYRSVICLQQITETAENGGVKPVVQDVGYWERREYTW